MRLRTALLFLILVINVPTHSKTFLMGEVKEASSREEFIYILSLFTELKTEKYVSSIHIKKAFGADHFSYQRKLCERFSLIEDEKNFLRVNKLWNGYVNENISILTKHQNELKKEIKVECSKL